MTLLGIIQEQHPARARLFMQWKRMHWPLMVDALDLLDVGVVPVTILIDAAGVVRGIQPREDDFARFLAAPTPETAARKEEHAAAAPVRSPDLESLHAAVARAGTADSLRDASDALILWGGEAGLDTAIGAYESALIQAPDDGRAHFRLGVAYRMRHDSPGRAAGDFARAVAEWGLALAIDPNQYIWRRRIQQYGPRLAKPYPFYDWVAQARTEVGSRGETPVALPVEPAGAEIARPLARFVTESEHGQELDPGGQITRDERHLIRVEATVVPARVVPGETARVHLIFRPDPAREAHWNNEAEPMTLWVAAPASWNVDTPLLSVPAPDSAISDEPRRVEFEVQTPGSFAGEQILPAYALYYVCEGADGTCLYRRQDVPVRIRATR